MVQWQLCTLEQLMSSGFGHPFPRHGLQLLFWFANHCVACELDTLVGVMKLVSECQPETGVYGFHRFGNVEELLPVLYRPKKHKSKRQFAYFEVGNLSTETYPESANLPSYVRENYGFEGTYDNCNKDRIIISYQVRTRVVETVYVTEHDEAAAGMFRRDGTHEIRSELIQALQNPQLDISTFLTQMGYYGDVQTLQDTEEMYHFGDPSVQLMLSMMQNDQFGFFPEAFSQHLNLNFDPSISDQHVQNGFNINANGSGPVIQYSEQRKKRSKKTKKPRAVRPSFWDSRWERVWQPPCKDLYEDRRYGGGGGDSRGGGSGGGGFLKILLGAGVIYLAAKCLSWWFRNCWNEDWDGNIFQMLPRRTYPRTHIMLDYVF
ncbi:uncharacterized protein PAE49_004334 isoform 1-T4 [Odontesthes bonariensis]|uniref:uncharacterized protein LOC142378612 n=1 Tax=Odontesthes bonariensis TaxID=219752 RepID=UPI003F5831FF